MNSAFRILGAAGYVIALLAAGILLPEHRGAVAFCAIVPLAMLVGPELLRRTLLAKRDNEAAANRSFPPHTPDQVKATIRDFNQEASPDVPLVVDYLIHQAAQLQSSDIHLVPYREFTAVRFRVDGILSDVAEI